MTTSSLSEMGISTKVVRNERPFKIKGADGEEMEVQMDDGIYASNEHLTL